MKNKLEYLGVVALWILIFGKNVFSHLIFVDYTPAKAGYLWQSLVVNDYNKSINAISLLRELFGFFGAEAVFFSFMILIGMLVSYFYISKLTEKNRILFAFIFFFSPFVYTRIMIGQLGIVIAYLLMPMFLFYLFAMLKKFEYENVLKVVLVMTLIGAMTPHFFVFMVLMVLIGGFWYRKNFGKKDLKLIGLFVLLLAVLNFYWIQGVLAGGVLGEIDSGHSDFFAPKVSSGISAISKILTMWGFWRENAFASAYGILPTGVWYVLLSALVLILFFGYYSGKNGKEEKFFYSLFWVGVIFGVGASHPYTKGLFELFFENVPFFNGFRDSHKFVVFIALAYAYFLPKAISKIKEKLKNNLLKILVCVVFVLLIFSINFQMVGLYGQVRNVDYPKFYKNADGFLSSQEVEGKIIYLPWEGYLTYTWSVNVSNDGRIGAFQNGIMKNIIYSGPDAYGGNSGFRLAISECLEDASIQCLKENGVSYVLRDKCAFYPDEYLWLGESVFENECLEIYYVRGKSEIGKIPLRFYFGILSFLCLVYIFYVLGSGRLRKGR